MDELAFVRCCDRGLGDPVPPLAAHGYMTIPVHILQIFAPSFRYPEYVAASNSQSVKVRSSDLE